MKTLSPSEYPGAWLSGSAMAFALIMMGYETPHVPSRVTGGAVTLKTAVLKLLSMKLPNMETVEVGGWKESASIAFGALSSFVSVGIVNIKDVSESHVAVQFLPTFNRGGENRTVETTSCSVKLGMLVASLNTSVTVSPDPRTASEAGPAAVALISCGGAVPHEPDSGVWSGSAMGPVVCCRVSWRGVENSSGFLIDTDTS